MDKQIDTTATQHTRYVNRWITLNEPTFYFIVCCFKNSCRSGVAFGNVVQVHIKRLIKKYFTLHLLF